MNHDVDGAFANSEELADRFEAYEPKPGDMREITLADSWPTDSDLVRARVWFEARVPGYVPPVAYSVARVDADRFTFGHVNAPGGTHGLPAAVLASVCGYASAAGAYSLTRDEFQQAVDLLSPAAAARHLDHPNLRSWQALLDEGKPGDEFVAVFVADLGDPTTGPADTALRALLQAS